MLKVLVQLLSQSWTIKWTFKLKNFSNLQLNNWVEPQDKMIRLNSDVYGISCVILQY